MALRVAQGQSFTIDSAEKNDGHRHGGVRDLAEHEEMVYHIKPTMKESEKEMAPVKLLFIGDSITGGSDLKKYLKFSQIIDLMLEAKLGARRVAVLNRGCGGDTTAKVLARLEKDVLAERPDIVVLLIGGNDAAPEATIPRETTAQNLETILTALAKVGSRVLLLQYHLLPNPESPQTAWTHLTINNELIAAIAAARRLPVLSMHPPMENALATHTVAELVNPIDGVHLNHGGELVYARTIFARLMELQWLPTSETIELDSLPLRTVP